MIPRFKKPEVKEQLDKNPLPQPDEKPAIEFELGEVNKEAPNVCESCQ